MIQGRIAPLALESLDETTQALIGEARQLMGFLPNDGLTMARVPGLVDAASALAAAAYRPGEVDMETKRLVALMASSAAGCVYCQSHNRFGGLQHGIAEDRLNAIWEYETSGAFDEAQRAAIRLAHHASLAPSQASDEDFTALKQHYSDDGIAEIVAVISLFGFLNRWNDTIRTEIETLPAQALEGAA